MTQTESSPLPFKGIRFLDLTRVIAGPLSGQIFADLGADVIKVESPNGGDATRGYVAQGDTEAQRTPLFWSLNRNKRSVLVDYKSASDMYFFHKLVASADVVIHNFRTGTAERLGIGYAELSAINDRLIYCSISGFGDVGPMKTRAANDVIVQGYSGVMSYTGPVGGPPVRCGGSIADFTAGLWATIGMLTALYDRTKTGRGQEVKTSLFEGQLNLVAHNLIEYWINGLVPTPMGSGTRLGLPNEAFPASDGSVLLAAVNDDAFTRLCTVIGKPGLATDPRFKDLSDRRINRDQLFEEVAEWTEQRTMAQCVEALDAGAIPCGPINDLAQVSADAQFAALDITQVVINDRNQEEKLVLQPLKFNNRRATVRTVAPNLGADTDDLKRELGIDA